MPNTTNLDDLERKKFRKNTKNIGGVYIPRLKTGGFDTEEFDKH